MAFTSAVLHLHVEAGCSCAMMRRGAGSKTGRACIKGRGRVFSVVRKQYCYYRVYHRVLRVVAQPFTAQRLHKRRIDGVVALRNRHAHSSCSIGRCRRDEISQLRGGVAVAQGLGEGLPLPSHVPRIATLSTRSDDAVKLKAVSAQQNPVGERSASGGKSTEKGSRRGLGYRRLLFAPYVVKARVLLGVCAATTQGVAFTAFAVE